MTPTTDPTAPARRHPGNVPALDNPRRCHATNKQTGERCGNWSIRGGTICKYHGGSAPQVKAKAQQRLEAAALHAAGYLVRAVDPTRDVDMVGLRAADSILDRTLGKAGQTVTHRGDSSSPLKIVHEFSPIPGLTLPPTDAIDVQPVEPAQLPVAAPDAPTAPHEPERGPD